MVAALAVVSCTKTTLEPLKGVYPEAQQPVLSTLVSSSFEKTESSRIFYLQFSGEGGAAVKTALVGPRAQYYLEPGVYGPGEKNLCFITNGGNTTVNGQAIIDGQISVKKEDDTYRFVFVLFDASGTAYRTMWKGDLVYEPDPEPVKLTKVLVAQKNDGSVTVKLGTDGMSVDGMGTPTGDGYALTADLYSADGFLHEGVYTAGDGTVLNPGEFAPGYEFDASSWGMGIFHWGTCWWAGEAVTHITSGTIEVAKKGPKYTITWGSEATYPNWAFFEGEIADLTPGDVPAPDYSFVDTAVPGAMDSSWQTHDDVTTHYVTVLNKAEEEVAYFQLVLANGTTDLSGEYPVVEYAHEDHTAGNGYDAGAYGVGGCRYYKDGELVLINPGDKVTVTKLADGIYEFSGNGYDFVVGEPGGSGAKADYVIADVANPGAMDSSWQTHDDVTTHYLTLTDAAGEEVAYFQLVLANGTTDLSGEYPVVEYAHEDHTAGNGYDAGAYGVGGCRYYKDGSLVFINPGEKVTVTALADGVYKFEGDGFEFVGQLAVE